MSTYLPETMPAPRLGEPGLEKPYWDATRQNRLVVQRCRACDVWQWGPEWICHECLSENLSWTDVPQRGRIFSWERVWHPVHSALKGATPYIAVLVELPDAGNVRMVGNLLGDPMQDVSIGAPVVAVFEPHDNADPPYTLVQWRCAQEGEHD